MNLVRTILAVMLLTGLSFAQHTGGGSGGGTGSGVTNVATTAPLGGGPITTTGTITCTTCATTTNGGALSGTAPMAISAAGAISCSSCLTGTAGGAGNAYASGAGQGVLFDTSITDSGAGGLTFGAGVTHITSTQGTLGAGGAFASTPFLSHTVTYNTTSAMIDDQRTFTCTAAGVGSSPFQIIQGGNPVINFQFIAANCATPAIDVSTGSTIQVRMRAGAGVQLGNTVGVGWNSAAGLGTGGIDTGMDRAVSGTIRVDANAALSDGLGKLQAASYLTTANCNSSAGTCAAASAGSVSIAAAATTVTVATTAVTANSNIFVFEDSSLGTKLTVTCNTVTGRTYSVTARTAATSFVITASAAPATNPACLNYLIID